MKRRDFMKLSIGTAAAAAIPVAAKASQPQVLFTIDEEYKRLKWVDIVSGNCQKRGGIVAVTNEAYIAIHSGKMKFTMPKGHIVDIFHDYKSDMVLVKLWGDDLPVVREGEFYPQIMVVNTRIEG